MFDHYLNHYISMGAQFAFGAVVAPDENHCWTIHLLILVTALGQYCVPSPMTNPCVRIALGQKFTTSLSFHPSWAISAGPSFLIISKCASVTSTHWFWCYCLVLYRTYPIFFSFDSLSTIWRLFLLPSVHLHFFLFQNEALLIFLFILYDMNLSALSSLLQEKDMSICIHFDCHTVIFFRYLYVWHFPHCLQLTQW